MEKLLLFYSFMDGVGIADVVLCSVYMILVMWGAWCGVHFAIRDSILLDFNFVLCHLQCIIVVKVS